MMGASEGDMSMFSSLNMQIAALNAGIDANIEWQWDGGHVPSEILGESLSLYVDEMYGKYVDGSVTFSLADAVSYRSAGASKAVPGFDVIDYGQEDYVFGYINVVYNSTADSFCTTPPQKHYLNLIAG